MKEGKKALDREFWKYILPSILITTLGVFYGIVDGLFIGRARGDHGLAAINIAWPITAIVTSTAMGIGIGGAVLMSIKRGEGKLREIRQAKGNTILLLGLLTILLTVFLYTFSSPILRFLGAEGQIYTYALDYVKIISLGSIFQIFSVGINPILRNDEKPKLAMAFMLIGLIANIYLDWLFIMRLDLGLSGAALATIIGQGLAAFLSTISIIKPKKNRLMVEDLRLDKNYIKDIIKIGLSPFGLSFAPSLIIVLTNWQAIRYGGNNAVAAYSILGYSIQTVQSMLQGIGDGVQPLISYYNGSNMPKNIIYIRNKSLRFGVVLSLLVTVSFIVLNKRIALIFGASSKVSEMVGQGIIISSLTFVFTAIVRFGCSFFYAVNKIKISSLLVYLEPLIISPIMLWLLPKYFGINGIWASLPATQFIMAVLSSIFLIKYEENLKVEETL